MTVAAEIKGDVAIAFEQLLQVSPVHTCTCTCTFVEVLSVCVGIGDL